MQKKRKWIAGIVIAVSMAMVLTGALAYLLRTKITVVAPTCLEKGYSVYVRGGKTQIKDIVDATGHDYSEWEILQAPTGVTEGQRTRTCKVCGWTQTEAFHMQGCLPQIHLTGDLTGIGKTKQVQVTAQFSIEGTDFDGYALMKYQGHSSLQYDKKSFTVKFFSDEECNEKQKFQFSHWNPEHKYILKANYLDTSRSRNLICADLWSQMVSMRQRIHPRLQKTSNLGATDGFPVEVYLNDTFCGTYNMTLHKDDDLFAMEDGQKDGIVIINQTATPAAFFKEAIDWETSPDWEVEYSGTDSTAWIKEKTDAFVSFVRSSTDQAFRTELHTYADVESLIDYLIAMYALGLPTHAAKDLILATYEDDVFIASMFDMEEAFGMKKDGSGFEDPVHGLPVEVDGILTSGTQSLLWDRMIRNFYPEICHRYRVLRAQVLSEKNIIMLAEEKINAIPDYVNQAEFALYPHQPMQDISHLDQIKAYTHQRLSLLDQIFGHL